MANEYRVTTVSAEVLSTGTSAAKITTVAVEVVQSNTSQARVTTVAVEVLSDIPKVPVTPATGNVTTVGKLPEAGNFSIDRTLPSADSNLYTIDQTWTIAGSGATSFIPGNATLTVSGYSPNLNITRYLTPGAGNVNVTGYAPTLSNTQSFSVPTAHFNVWGDAPTLDITPYTLPEANYTPDPGNINISGNAPSYIAFDQTQIYQFWTSVTYTGGVDVRVENYNLSVTHTGNANAIIEDTDVRVLHTGRPDGIIDLTNLTIIHTGLPYARVEDFYLEVLVRVGNWKPQIMII